MTHDEIRALVAVLKNPNNSHHVNQSIAAIETLLAQWEAIREAVEQHADCYNNVLCDAMREILNQ